MPKTAPPRPISDDQARMARLVVFEPGEPARAYPFAGRRVDIGRLPVNGVCLDDPRVSGMHAQVVGLPNEPRFEIVDRGSSNGTFVEGRRVERCVLEDQAVVRVGDTLLVFEEGLSPARELVPTRSLWWERLRRQAAVAAENPAPLLLFGPTGSGKGYLARKIAEASERAQPFVLVNCAAMPPDLVESQLFGHVRGAFTGASSDHLGLFRAADGGTLFLDEVGAIPPNLQAKLLTALEEQVVRPIGATAEVRVDVRVIAATNLDVDAALADGRFREDLFYRLSAQTIELPVLKKRRVDIVRLGARALDPPDHRSFTPEALEALLLYDWPGNIRELLNLGEQFSYSSERPIDYSALPAEWTRFLYERSEPVRPGPQSQAPPKAVLRAELEACGGNVSEVARRLGKHRNQVVRWLDAYGMRKRRSGPKT